MEITVLLEPKEGHGYRASSGAPLATEAEGTSREEALCNLRAHIENKLRSGAEILTLEVGQPTHSWAQFAGTLKDDPWARHGSRPWPNTVRASITIRMRHESVCP